MNLKLSKNVSLCLINLPLSSSLLIGTEKVIYFAMFSPEHSN